MDDANAEAFFELSGDTNNENVSCAYHVPATTKIEVNACEVFRTQSLAQGKLSQRDYDYLK